MNTTTTETIAKVMAAQSIVPQWMSELAAAHGTDAGVIVTRKHTQFGTFVLHVEVAA